MYCRKNVDAKGLMWSRLIAERSSESVGHGSSQEEDVSAALIAALQYSRGARVALYLCRERERCRWISGAALFAPQKPVLSSVS